MYKNYFNYCTKKNAFQKERHFVIYFCEDYKPIVHPVVQVGTPDPFPAPVAVALSV